MSKNKHVVDKYTGNIVPLPALYKENYSLNISGMRQHLEYLIENGVRNIYLAKAASEFEYMTREERIRVVKMVQDVVSQDKEVNYIAQPIGEGFIGELQEEAKIFSDLGVDVMVVKAPSFKTEQKFFSSFFEKRVLNSASYELIICEWLEKISDLTKAYIIYHDQPYKGLDFLDKVLSIKNVVGIKTHEENPETRFDIYGRYGADNICFDGMWKYHQIWSLTWGARSRHSNWSWFDPKGDKQFIEAVNRRDLTEAFELTNAEWPVAKAIIKTGYHGYKILMSLVGLPYSPVRIPGSNATKEEHKMIKDAAKKVGLI